MAKRALDVAVSAGVVLVGLLPGALLAAVIAAQSKGAPFYTQRRLGLGGRHFDLIKFRSMVADADDVEKYLSAEQLAQWERERKVDDDPRITKVGRFIRKTSIDELPQFLNVLKGDMSIVGPRPIVDAELSEYGEDAARFLSRLPGITGWWQVEARNDVGYEGGSRQQMELWYIDHASLRLDASIFLRTFAVFGNSSRGTGR